MCTEILSRSKLVTTGFRAFSAADQKDIHLIGALGLVLADSVQDSTHARHGGTASDYNCAHCTVLTKDRLDTKLPICDWQVARTTAQTDMIVQSCSAYLQQLQASEYHGESIPISVVEDIRRAFGLST